MNAFQIVLLCIAILLLLLTGAATLRRWIPFGMGVLFGLLWIGAGVAAIDPELTTEVARLVGIRRGADLLLYCTVVVMMIGFLMMYVRLRRLRTEITTLVREIAIQRADDP